MTRAPTSSSPSSNTQASGSSGDSAGAKKPIELSFYYPVQVGGPVTAIIDRMAAEFTEENPDIIVKPIYAGSYSDTKMKVQAAVMSNTPPDVAVLLATDLFDFLDMDAIIPLRRICRARRRRGVPERVLPGLDRELANQWPRLQHSVPAQHRRDVLQQRRLQRSRIGSGETAANVGRIAGIREEADEGRPLGNRTAFQWPDKLQLDLPGLRHPERHHL